MVTTEFRPAWRTEHILRTFSKNAAVPIVQLFKTPLMVVHGVFYLHHAGGCNYDRSNGSRESRGISNESVSMVLFLTVIPLI
jgi:hypothetical protein